MGCSGIFSGLLVLKVLKKPLIVPQPRTEATYSRGRTRSGGFVMLNRQWTIPAGAQRSHGHVRLNVQIMFYISMSETFSFASLDAAKCLKVFPPSETANHKFELKLASPQKRSSSMGMSRGIIYEIDMLLGIIISRTMSPDRWCCCCLVWTGAWLM